MHFAAIEQIISLYARPARSPSVRPLGRRSFSKRREPGELGTTRARAHGLTPFRTRKPAARSRPLPVALMSCSSLTAGRASRSRFGVERVAVQAHQRLRQSRSRRRLAACAAPGRQPLHETRDGRASCRSPGTLRAGCAVFSNRVLDVQIQAAPRSASPISASVRGEHHQGHVFRRIVRAPEFVDLEIREHFERKASKPSSARSISSISSTAGPSRRVIARSKGARASTRARRSDPRAGAGRGPRARDLEAQQLALVVPLVERGVGVRPRNIAAGSGRSRAAGETFAISVLPTPGRLHQKRFCISLGIHGGRDGGLAMYPGAPSPPASRGSARSRPDRFGPAPIEARRFGEERRPQPAQQK